MKIPGKVLLLVLLAYCLLMGLFFYPALRQGGHLFFDDSLGASYPYHLFHSGSLTQASSAPLWDPFAAGGFPAIGNPEMNFYDPASLIFLFLPGPMAMDMLVLLHLVLAAFFTYLYCRSIGCLSGASFLAGVAYALSGSVVGNLHILTFVQTYAWFPLFLFFLERSRLGFSWPRTIMLCLTLSLLVLASAPQLAIYIILFSAFYLLALPNLHGNRPYLDRMVPWSLALCGAVVVGSVYLWPVVEFMVGQSVRRDFSYSLFSSVSMQGKELLKLFFPFIFGAFAPNTLYTKVQQTGFDASFRETACYTGMPVLLLALSSLLLWKKDARVRFWAGTSLLVLSLSLGSNNPLTRLLYYIPVYNHLRAPTRWLFLFNFSMAVLSALALSRFRLDDLSRLAYFRIIKTILFLALTVGLSVALGWVPGLTLNSPELLVPMVLILLSAVAVTVLVARRVENRPAALLLPLLFLDLYLFGGFYGWRDHATHDLHLGEYGKAWWEFLDHRQGHTPPGRGDFRVFNLNYPSLSDKVHDNFGALLGLEAVNGFNGPHDLARMAALLNKDPESYLWKMPNRLSLFNSPVLLDLLNTRYLTARLDPRSVEQSGMEFLDWNIPWTVSSVCPQRTVHLDTPVYGTRIGMVSRLNYAFDTRDNEPVARITVIDQHGARYDKFLLAGRDTAETGYGKEYFQRLIGPHSHGLAPLATSWVSDPEAGLRYIATMDLPGRKRVRSITIRLLKPEVSFTMDGLSLFDGLRGRSFPVPCDLLDPRRWGYLGRFGEVDFFENRQAQPRAWMVSRTLHYPAAQVLGILQSGLLPDGTPFDPARDGLLEIPGTNSSRVAALSPVKITRYDPNQIELECSSSFGGLLVLSENNYPGWRVFVDGKEKSIVTTDYILRGVDLGPGTHKVVFTFLPPSLIWGWSVSWASLVLLLLFGARRVVRGRSSFPGRPQPPLRGL